MKRILTVVQVLLILLFVYVFCFTGAPATAMAILFAAVLLLLTFAAHLASDAAEKRLRTRVTELLKELNVASSRIGSVSQEIGITIGESNDSSRVLFDETREMRDLTADVAEILGDMIRQLKGMIDFTEEARATALTMDTASQDALRAVQVGMTELDRIINTMKTIKITSTKTADSINKLQDASGSVRTIIEKINDISKQMHIIAINASVEASRAGRYGQSFAVVAREFQSLSGMTDHALREISTLIDTIQADIAEAYSAVRDNSGSVDAGVRCTTSVENSLKAIDASFTQVTRMVSRMGSIAEEESQLAGIMGGYIDNVESLVDRTNGNVRRVVDSVLDQKQGIENIADMGAKLQAASRELLGIAGSGTEAAEKLDSKTQEICAGFFPVMKSALAENPELIYGDRSQHVDILSRFKTQHRLIEAVWTNELNGRFICSIPKAGIANAAMRDWFIAAMKGQSYISPIYISGITKNRCVTLSMPYLDDTGNLSGIVGVDLNLDLLKSETR